MPVKKFPLKENLATEPQREAIDQGSESLETTVVTGTTLYGLNCSSCNWEEP